MITTIIKTIIKGCPKLMEVEGTPDLWVESPGSCPGRSVMALFPSLQKELQSTLSVSSKSANSLCQAKIKGATFFKIQSDT